MIAPSFKRVWPADRLERLKALQALATVHGFRLDATNMGSRAVFMARIEFSRAGRPVAQHFSIADAERWLKEKTGVAL